MRKAALFWSLLAVVCGTVLFHTSQEVTDGRNALRRMDRELTREEESIRVLKAEWSYLNQPERLEKLAAQYLDLQPLQGRQFARISDINERVDDKLLADTAAEAAPLVEPAAGVIAPSADAVPAPKPVAAVKPAPAPVAAKTVTAKPAAPKAAAKTFAPIAAPVHAMQPKTAPAVTPVAATAPSREFGDVMKSLGVQ